MGIRVFSERKLSYFSRKRFMRKNAKTMRNFAESGSAATSNCAKKIIFAFFACKQNAKNNFAQKSLRNYLHFLRATATINCAIKNFMKFSDFSHANKMQRNSFSRTMPNCRDTISPFR